MIKMKKGLEENIHFDDKMFNELWTLLQESSKMTKNIMDNLVTKNGRGHMVLLRFLHQSYGKAFVDWMRKFRKVLGLDKEFSLLLDIDEKNKYEIYEDQFLPQLKKWSGRPEEFNYPSTYEDLLHLPCILTVVDKGKMGITYPKSLKYFDLRVRYYDTCNVTRAALEQDFGRVCRYEETDNEYKLPVVLLSQ